MSEEMKKYFKLLRFSGLYWYYILRVSPVHNIRNNFQSSPAMLGRCLGTAIEPQNHVSLVIGRGDRLQRKR